MLSARKTSKTITSDIGNGTTNNTYLSQLTIKTATITIVI